MGHSSYNFSQNLSATTLAHETRLGRRVGGRSDKHLVRHLYRVNRSQRSDDRSMDRMSFQPAVRRTARFRGCIHSRLRGGRVSQGRFVLGQHQR